MNPRSRSSCTARRSSSTPSPSAAACKTALVTTAGFRDVLEIGRGNRPDMYNLQVPQAETIRAAAPPLRSPRARRRGWRGLDAAGTARPGAIAARCQAEGVEAIAVCFLHAYAHPEHEEAAAAFLRARLPGVLVTRLVRDHPGVARVRAQQHGCPERLCAADPRSVPRRPGKAAARGGADRASFCHALERWHRYLRGGADRLRSTWSNPVRWPGVTGARVDRCSNRRPEHHRARHRRNDGQVLADREWRGADHGPTTGWRQTPRSPGYPVKIPVVDIVEIGAGGGSIAWFDDGGALRVGPISAGADPGPACYGRGGTRADRDRRAADRRRSRSDLLPGRSNEAR